MRLLRQGIGFLFRACLVGILIFSSNSWAMDPPKKAQSIQTLENFPPDLLVWGMCWKFLSPLEWARASGVNRHWYRSFNNILLWQSAGWAGLVSPHPENDNKAVQILNDLFTSPNLAKVFAIPANPTPSLETFPWRCYKKQPTDQQKLTVAKERCLIKYWNNLRKAEKTLLEMRVDRENCANARQTKLKNVIIPALKDLKHYHPEIVWKVANILSPGERHYICRNGNYIGLNDFSFKNDLSDRKNFIFLDKNYMYLDAALAGHPKARATVVRTLLEALQGLLLNPSEGREQLKLCFNLLGELAEIWPEGRVHLLRYELSSGNLNALQKKDPNAQYRIGDGRKTTLAVGLPFPIKWREVPLVEGESFYNLYKEKNFNELNRVLAQNLFEEAYKQGAVGSLLAYVKSLKPTSENLEFFQKVHADLENLETFKRSTETSETLGTVFLKLCQNKLAAIPENAGDNDPAIGDFLNVFEEGYRALSRNKGFLPTYGHNQLIHDFLYNLRDGEFHLPNCPIKREHHLLAAVAQSLPQGKKYQSVRYAFIDWNTKEFPSYCTTGWIKYEITDYLQEKWGVDFCNKGILRKTGTWNERDTAYANIYFSSNTSRTVRRKFYATLMNIALERKEEKTFSGAFTSYCHSLGLYDKLGVTHCKLLDKNLSDFLRVFPRNVELPFLFGQFVLEQKKWIKNTNTTPWKEKAMEYCEVAATNGSPEALEAYKILAINGSPKAIGYFQERMDNGSEDARDFLVSLPSMGNNEPSSEEPDSEEAWACNFLASFASMEDNESSRREEPPTKKRKLSLKKPEEDN